ncbi:Monooxygenase mdpK [Lasiodiplodia hormozganensis]|uniref:Monooxygenase mdpK n=1 Tax=Lasiodiplodia hormozganensis TaxID=869390 RepID=A0AA39Y2L6_9PEZI|nr:Monooxygenase mdpK [Lasiodiplodia hormozganensis]
MATYAVLGATGNTGNSLIQNLLQSPDARVHAYCRNRTKLIRILPNVADNKKVKIFEGSIDDVDLLADCIRGTKAVFLTVTTNDNVPGCRLSQDSALTVIRALEKIREASGPGGATPLPKLVHLSSATLDDHLNRNMPAWFKPIMKTAASHVYEDLRQTEEILRAQQDWVSTIFIKPGGLSVDKQRGHKLSFDEQESFISYLDLAAAMIEAADDPDGRYDMRNVGVVNTGGGAQFPRGTPLCITVGLLRHFFPWLHPYLPSTGPS